MNQDQPYEQYLKVLSVFHYVVGGIAGLFACFPIFHLLLGLSMLVMSLVPGTELSSDAPFSFLPFAVVGLMFVMIPTVIILLGWAFAASEVIAGVYLNKRRRYMFCLVMAGVECMFMPFGTVLGVFTIITLLQPTVKEMFQEPV